MRALDVLDKVEATSGKNAKVAVLADFNKDEELRFLLDSALNFKHKFHIKKFNIPASTKFPHSEVFTHFKHLLAGLKDRTWTGNEAIQKVETFLASCNDQQQKWYARIIRKDLKAGFDISTANKAGFDIPKFDVMLAKDGKKCNKLQEIVSQGVYCSPKLDGYRCIAICSYGEITLLSRNGTEYQNFPSVVETLKKWCQDSSFVLDGEIMSNDFNAMQQTAFAAKRGTTVGDVKYHVFGWIAHDEWESEKFKMPTKQRLQNRDALLAKYDDDNIVSVEQRLVHKVEDVLQAETDYIAQGHEGAMILPNIPYFKGKKSNKLMKFKTMHSQDCEVTGVYEGEGKYEGSLGGMHVLQEDGVTKCDVGSGFTDQDRQYIWNNPSAVIGRKAEIKYQELTGDGVMRFPIFLRWRDDK